MSLPRWCAERGLDGRSLRYWVDRSAPASVIRMVDVTPTPPSPSSAPFSAPVQVCIEDVTLFVPDGFSDDTLARVLRAVRGC